MPQYDVLEDDFEGQTLANNLSTYLQYQVFQNEHHGLSIGGSLYFNDVAHGTFQGSNFEQGAFPAPRPIPVTVTSNHVTPFERAVIVLDIA